MSPTVSHLPRALRAVAALVVALLAGLAACAGDATAPSADPAATARLAIAAHIGSIAEGTGEGPPALRIAVAYYRGAGDSVPLGTQTFPLSAASTQQLPITLDISTCLNDHTRLGANLGSGASAVCVLRVDFALLAGTTVLDTQSVPGVPVHPGQTLALDRPITLYTVAAVVVAPTTGPTLPANTPARLVLGRTMALGASPIDAAGQPVTGRTARWLVDAPNIATIDTLTGTLTPHAPGRALVTAVVGGRTGTLVVNVVPGPSAVTVAGGLGSGSVTSQPAGIACQIAAGQSTGACSASFASDSVVTLVATPAAGSSFASWAGDCASAGGLLTCQITPSAPRSVGVTFVAFHTLAVTLAGAGNGTVTSAPAGVSCSRAANAACAAAYLDGTSVTLTAAPTAASSFAGWGGACTGATLACTVTISQAQAVTATFVPRQLTLTLNLGGAGGGTVAATGSGVTGAGTCSLATNAGSTACPIAVQAGTTVTLTPTAGAGSAFGGWAGACAPVSNAPCTLTLTTDASVGAVFTRLPVPLTVASAVGSAGAGTVATGDTTISCALGGATTNGRCQSMVAVGATVTLRATPASGQVFLGWGGACAGAGTTPACTLTVRTASTVTAAFGPPQTLTLTLGGTGGGSVTGAGAPCVLVGGAGGVTCTPAVTYGGVDTLRATPDSASTFAGWGGACTGAAACVVTLDQARAVSATFTHRTATITFALGGAGGGSVVQNGAAVCTLAPSSGSTTCTRTVPLFTTVAFTATPSANAQFSGWAGPCSRTGACQFTVASDVTLGATFTPAQYTLTLAPGNMGGTGTGTLYASVPGSNSVLGCSYGANGRSGTCIGQFPAGTVLTVSASPDTGSGVQAWTGACRTTPASSSSCRVTMTQNLTVGASFAGPYAVTVVDTVDASSGGFVTDSNGVNCGVYYAGSLTATTCPATYWFGRAVRMTALPSTYPYHSYLAGWGGLCAGQTGLQCQFTAAAGNVSAHFKAAQRFSLQAGDSVYTGTSAGQVVVSTSGLPNATVDATWQNGGASAYFGPGNTVTLTAQTSGSATFVGWGGDCQTAGSNLTCTLTTYASGPNARYVVAVFAVPRSVVH